MKTTLPLSLFGDGLMVVEFMSVFGPLFNLKEVVRNDVTFGEREGKNKTPSLAYFINTILYSCFQK